MSTPTLYDWLGGRDALEPMIADFYTRVALDPLVGPVFEGMGEDHPRHVAGFIGEVFGGPATYSAQHGGHAGMVRHHIGKALSEVQRRRWIALLLDAYEDSDLPKDPEFASSLVGYLEWGSRIAVLNSAPGMTISEDAPMPRWGWGETGGPWQPESKT